MDRGEVPLTRLPRDVETPPAAEPAPPPAATWAYRAALLLAAAVALLAALPPLGEWDLWFHLSTGDWLLREGAFPREEPWAHTVPPGRVEVVHGWLADVALAGLRARGGAPALWLVMPVVVGAGLLAQGLLLRRQGWAPRLCVALPFLTLALYADRLRLRPDVLGLVLYPLLLAGLAGWHRAGRVRARPAAACLLLVALWANLHPSCVTAPALAAALWLGARLAGQPGLPALAPPLLFLATLLSPNGVAVWTYVRESARVAPWIEEWAPSWAYLAPATPERWALGLAPWLALGLIAAGWRRPGPAGPDAPRTWVGVGLAGALLALLKARYLFLCHLPLAVSAPPAWRRPQRATAIAAALLGAATLQLLVARHEHLAATLRGPPAAWRADLPAGAASFLRALPGEPLRLWHPQAWGAYLADQCPGKVRIFIDGRAPLYGPELFQEQAQLTDPRRPRAERERLLAARGVQALVVLSGTWPRGGPWFQAYVSPRADVFLHRERAAAHIAGALDLYRARGLPLPPDVDLDRAEATIAEFLR